jgi:hypothetical protein
LTGRGTLNGLGGVRSLLLALEGGKCLGTRTLQGLTCEVKECWLARPGPSHRCTRLTGCTGLGWKGAWAVPDLASAGLIDVGWPFFCEDRLRRWKGCGLLADGQTCLCV